MDHENIIISVFYGLILSIAVCNTFSVLFNFTLSVILYNNI